MPKISRRLYPQLPEKIHQWARPHCYIAKVTKVSDGDSVHVACQLGFGVAMPEIRVRLLGIDAPELVGVEKMQGHHSRRQLEKFILNEWIGLETYQDQSCKYGRWLGVLWRESESDLINVNRWMVEMNLAKPMKVNRFFDAKPEHLNLRLERCESCNSFILP